VPETKQPHPLSEEAEEKVVEAVPAAKNEPESKPAVEKEEEETEEKVVKQKSDEFMKVKEPNNRMKAIIKQKKEEERNRIMEKGLDIDTYEREYAQDDEQPVQEQVDPKRKGKGRDQRPVFEKEDDVF